MNGHWWASGSFPGEVYRRRQAAADARGKAGPPACEGACHETCNCPPTGWNSRRCSYGAGPLRGSLLSVRADK